MAAFQFYRHGSLEITVGELREAEGSLFESHGDKPGWQPWQTSDMIGQTAYRPGSMVITDAHGRYGEVFVRPDVHSARRLDAEVGPLVLRTLNVANQADLRMLPPTDDERFTLGPEAFREVAAGADLYDFSDATPIEDRPADQVLGMTVLSWVPDLRAIGGPEEGIGQE